MIPSGSYGFAIGSYGGGYTISRDIRTVNWYLFSIWLKKNSARFLLEVYHVLDRDEGHEDDNDEKGVRVYGSRTEIGAINAIAEKRPWFAEPRQFFFSFISVPFYNYYWGFTAAQIELMMTDLPLIVYLKNNNKKNDKNTPKGGHGFTMEKRVSNEEYEKELAAWRERIKQKPKALDLRWFNIGFKSKIGV